MGNLKKDSIQLTFDSLPNEVGYISCEITCMKSMISEMMSNMQPKIPTEFMTRDEVSKMLKCDLVTVHNWTIAGKLTKYCIGNRTYYKRGEVEAAIKPIYKTKSYD